MILAHQESYLIVAIAKEVELHGITICPARRLREAVGAGSLGKNVRQRIIEQLNLLGVEPIYLDEEGHPQRNALPDRQETPVLLRKPGIGFADLIG